MTILNVTGQVEFIFSLLRFSMLNVTSLQYIILCEKLVKSFGVYQLNMSVYYKSQEKYEIITFNNNNTTTTLYDVFSLILSHK